jgi:hypothetical protein
MNPKIIRSHSTSYDAMIHSIHKETKQIMFELMTPYEETLDDVLKKVKYDLMNAWKQREYLSKKE